MKIASFNINNVNKRLANLIAWLRMAKPDVACLQELKAADREFPRAAIEKAGYGVVWRGEKSWNGVAILARDCEPILTREERARSAPPGTLPRWPTATRRRAADPRRPRNHGRKNLVAPDRCCGHAFPPPPAALVRHCP